MDIINRLMNRTFLFYIATILTCIIVMILGVVGSRKRDAMAFIAIASACALVVICITSFVPFMKDYFANDVIETDAVYINTLGDISKSHSTNIGMNSVVLDTDAGRISVTTIPFSKDLFPTGKYHVTAWYTKRSAWLVYVEVLEP